MNQAVSMRFATGSITRVTNNTAYLAENLPDRWRQSGGPGSILWETLAASIGREAGQTAAQNKEASSQSSLDLRDGADYSTIDLCVKQLERLC